MPVFNIPYVPYCYTYDTVRLVLIGLLYDALRFVVTPRLNETARSVSLALACPGVLAPAIGVPLVSLLVLWFGSVARLL